ncbi:Endoribonuclease YSH1 [Frankliniella fusca]|uniref:Endoribonuclease YSH1 n=1 Tax=Frankliniella fusca TaxID=407009 RepID=A0AAE1H8L2_9NEOP|nr:Endoribonuclease YSH1 [Frankliniella fusca]
MVCAAWDRAGWSWRLVSWSVLAMAARCRLLLLGTAGLLLLVLLTAPARAERSYTLFIEGVGIDESDPEWFGAEKTWMKVRTVNKTMNVAEWDLDLLKEITADVKSNWNMMQKADGGYKPSSIKGSATVCDDLHSKRPSIRALGYSRSNLPKSCPIKEGLYMLRNHIPNENYFPVIIPGDQWRLSNTWSSGAKSILKFHIDIKIDRTRKLQG